MIKFLVYACIVLLCVGFLIMFVSFYREFIKKKSLSDTDISYLNNNTEKVKLASEKYGKRIRGSVRLSQGRIKDMDDVYSVEEHIKFPKK